MLKGILSNRYLAVLLITLSVWIVANIANLLLFIIIAFIEQSNSNVWQGTSLILTCSSMFSFPGIIVFGIVFLFSLRSSNLFTILLITAFSTSFLSVLLFLLCWDITAYSQSFNMYVVAIVSAVGSVVLHRALFTAATKAFINTSIDHENLNP